MRTVEGNFFKERGIVGDDHAAFAERGDVFLLVETEATRDAHAARFASVVFRAQGMTGIFDHRKAVFFRERQDGVHVATLSVKVDGQHGFGIGGQLFLQLIRIEVTGDGIDIDEIDFRAQRHAGSRSGDPGQRRGQHAVAGFDIQREQG